MHPASAMSVILQINELTLIIPLFPLRKLRTRTSEIYITSANELGYEFVVKEIHKCFSQSRKIPVIEHVDRHNVL